MKKGTFKPNPNAARDAITDDEGCIQITLGSYVATNGLEIPVTITTQKGGMIERLLQEELAKRMKEGVVCITDLKREKGYIKDEGVPPDYARYEKNLREQAKALDMAAFEKRTPLPDDIIRQLEEPVVESEPDQTEAYKAKVAYHTGLVKGGMDTKEAWDKATIKYGAVSDKE